MTKEERMFALIEEAQQSKDTIAALCEARGLNIKTCYYWRKKLLASSSATATGFIPLVPTVQATEGTIRISYPNGVSVHLPTADLSMIAQLVRLA